MKAAVYSRKSRFTGRGESVENQVQLCREYGMKHLGIAEEDFIIYEDEGFSGGNINRPQLKKLLESAAAGWFDVLICYRLDRISRNISDFTQLIRDLNQYGIHFVSLREQFDTTTPMGRAMMYIASVFAQLERETIAERIRDNMLQLARTGRWLGGVTPTGYRSEALTAEDGSGRERICCRLVEVPEEAAVVRLIYEKYAALGSLTGVERFLKDKAVLTKNGRIFRRDSLRFILGNPVYAVADGSLYDYLVARGFEVYSPQEEFDGRFGLAGYNRTRQDGVKGNDKGNGKESRKAVGMDQRKAAGKAGGRSRDCSEWVLAVGLHPGIIESRLWMEVQDLLAQNRSGGERKIKNPRTLLAGVLYCGSCGSFMRPRQTQRRNREGEPVFYYMCELKERSKGEKCTADNLNGNRLDRRVWEEIGKMAVEKQGEAAADGFFAADSFEMDFFEECPGKECPQEECPCREFTHGERNGLIQRRRILRKVVERVLWDGGNIRLVLRQTGSTGQGGRTESGRVKEQEVPPQVRMFPYRGNGK